MPCLLFVLVLLVLAACRKGGPRDSASREDASSGAPTTAEAESEGQPLFVDRTTEAGLDFVHVAGGTGRYYLPEIMGSGGALADFDNDGDLDVYLVQGAAPGSENLEGGRDRLFRNDLESAGRLRFTDVTSESGVTAADYGMGVAAGDFDGDGRVDLYVTNFGANRMLRNNGAATGISFEDVTRATGTAEERWSVAAAFFDYDRDGRLDLYVGNYLAFTLGTHKPCFDVAGAADYCGPTAYRGVGDRLFRNRGPGGPFEDVSLPSGVGRPRGRSLGAVAADFDGDGWPDLYVANDGEPNHLWINRGSSGSATSPTFRDGALLAGCAVNEDGRPEASMGVAAGDFDHDGDDDLFVTHLTGETNTLYRNEGGGRFTDLTRESGLGRPSWQLTGFGTGWLDFDSDGWLDLVTLNGAVTTIQELAQAGDLHPFHQTKQLLRNRGAAGGGAAGRFEDVTAQAGAVFQLSEVGRGAAFGDVDNDGDLDVLVLNNGGPARLLLNTTDDAHSWIGLEPLGESGQVVLGARLEVLVPGRPVLWRRTATGGSYASASDPRVVVGLGASREDVVVRVHWPDGRVESWSALTPGRYHRLQQTPP